MLCDLHTFLKFEVNYSTTEKEGLPVHMAVRYFCLYLDGHKSNFFTDPQVLPYPINMNEPPLPKKYTKLK